MSNSIALLALEAADGTVVLTSITLVFAMLVALCLIITVEGKIFDAIKNKKNGTKAAPRHLPPMQRPLHRPHRTSPRLLLPPPQHPLLTAPSPARSLLPLLQPLPLWVKT